MQPRSRVVVTGVGVVTSIGTGVESFWRALLGGDCGIGPVESFDTSKYSVHIGGEVRDFDPAPFVKQLPVNRMGRASQLAIAAARLALKDAGLSPEALPSEKVGVSMGTTSGEPRSSSGSTTRKSPGSAKRSAREFIERYPSTSSPRTSPPSSGFGGLNVVDSDGLRRRQLRDRARAATRFAPARADVMLAGGADCFLAHHLHRLRAAGRDRARALPAVRPRTARGWCPARARRCWCSSRYESARRARRAHLRRGGGLRPLLRRATT